MSFLQTKWRSPMPGLSERDCKTRSLLSAIYAFPQSPQSNNINNLLTPPKNELSISSVLQFHEGFVHEHATEVKYVIVGIGRLFFFFSLSPPPGKMLEGNHSVGLCCLLLK